MPGRRDAPLLRISAFEVRIGKRDVGFAEVSRLSSESVEAASADGAGRDVPHFASVVLRRALSTSTDLYDWRRSIVDGKADRRDVTISQLSGPGGRPVNTWRLVGAWPARWSGPAFDARSGEIAFEEIELRFDDLVWLRSDTSTTGG
jgi:phage tail-like protein